MGKIDINKIAKDFGNTKETLTQTFGLEWILKIAVNGDPLNQMSTLGWKVSPSTKEAYGDYVVIKEFDKPFLQEVKQVLREQAQDRVFVLANLNYATVDDILWQIGKRIDSKYCDFYAYSGTKYCVVVGERRIWKRKGIGYYSRRLFSLLLKFIFKMMSRVL